MLIIPNAARRLQSGVGLVEVMVAVLILAIGLLGVASMQAMTLKATQGSYDRGVALMSAYSILDAMRPYRSKNLTDFAMGETCDPSQISGVRKDWLENLQKNLGSGNSTCGTIAVNGKQVTVTIQWDGSRAAGGESETIETMVIGVDL